jgi:hypothetical protein
MIGFCNTSGSPPQRIGIDLDYPGNMVSLAAAASVVALNWIPSSAYLFLLGDITRTYSIRKIRKYHHVVFNGRHDIDVL